MEIKQHFSIRIDKDTCFSGYPCGDTHTCHLIGKTANINFTFSTETVGKLGELIATLRQIERLLKTARTKELAREIAILEDRPILIQSHSNGNGNGNGNGEFATNELEF